MNEPALWISGGALFLSTILAVIGFIRKPTFVAVSVVDELRRENTDLRARIETMRREFADLETRVRVLISERDYYIDEVRKLRSANNAR